MTKRDPLWVHLVGSVPLADAEAVFRTVCASVGPCLRRIPDGETGARRRWVGMLNEILEHHPSFERDPDEPAFTVPFVGAKVHRELRRLRIRHNIDPQAIRFETGYAAMAIDSFVIFDCLQRDGVIPQGIKFQISIPSPLAPAYNYISRPHRDIFLEMFTNHLVEEVQQIAAALPHDRVAIQWDVLQEVLLWEGCFPDRPDNYRNLIATVLGRIGEAVPRSIEVGYHLCFGGSQNDLLVQPRDAGVLAEIMREILKHVRRPIQYFHFPVPHDHADAAFYAPFKSMSVPTGTELYVGLVHMNDDEGNKKRLELARHHIPVAGVASVCGWGRCEPAHVGALLDSARKIVA